VSGIRYRVFLYRWGRSGARRTRRGAYRTEGRGRGGLEILDKIVSFSTTIPKKFGFLLFFTFFIDKLSYVIIYLVW